MRFEDIAWLPLCGGLTAVGAGLAYLAFRRRGAVAGLRATAWALLPLAAYLTGALRTLWNIGSAIVGFVAGLVLSPSVWAGVALAGLSAVLFVVSGTLRGRTLSRARRRSRAQPDGGGATGTAGAAGAAGAAGKAPGGAAGASAPGRAKEAPRPVGGRTAEPAGDGDFSEIEDILKRRGIG
ncbi:cellulose synthase [Microbispora sp. RL4-1S]|uniref:Cellulose synthase n=1 Tax=Microbispora oryzae TaxID=2806554 RepID=A0A941AIB6_9ACTN|nr:cellulose synthase [Microbispora oryzae]MBP2703662.1 cellulose synthase [Microbispora oryzae]